MEKWLPKFKKAVQRKMPQNYHTDAHGYNKFIEGAPGIERSNPGFEHIYVCIDELYTLGFEDFEAAIKFIDNKCIIEKLRNDKPLRLYAIMQDGTLKYIDRAGRKAGFKMKFERLFNRERINNIKGADPFKYKKKSLCLLITDRADFVLPGESVKILKRNYASVVLLNLSVENAVTTIK